MGYIAYQAFTLGAPGRARPGPREDTTRAAREPHRAHAPQPGKPGTVQTAAVPARLEAAGA